jgi:hypothetical protein
MQPNSSYTQENHESRVPRLPARPNRDPGEVGGVGSVGIQTGHGMDDLIVGLDLVEDRGFQAGLVPLDGQE